jgi:TatD DNase family protein
MAKFESNLVDYHCHLDLYPNYAEQFIACSTKRIATLAVTTTPRAWPRNRELAEQSPFVRVGLGLHPQLIGQFSDELAVFEQYFPQARFVGEVGLDASPEYFKNYAKQKQVFERILRMCSDAGRKILSVHSVRATREVLNMVEAFLPPERGRVVLHWFGGTEAEAVRAVRLGCYFSINGEMLKKDSRKAVVTHLPVDRLITETDGPFTGVQPGNVSFPIAALAKIFEQSEEGMRRQVAANLAVLESDM